MKRPASILGGKIKKKNVGESRSDLVDRLNRLILALIIICNFHLLAEPIK